MFLKAIAAIYLISDLIHFFGRRINYDPNSLDNILTELVFESTEVSLTRYVLLIAVIVSTNDETSWKTKNVVSFLLFLTFFYFSYSNLMFHLTRGSLLYELYFTELIAILALISILSSPQEDKVDWRCLVVPFSIFVTLVLLFEVGVFDKVMAMV